MAIVENNYPYLVSNLKNIMSTGDKRIYELSERIITLYSEVANGGVKELANSFAWLVMETNRLQLEYELSGVYSSTSFSEAKEKVYDKTEIMKRYMLALVVTQFAWKNHFDLWCFYCDKFLQLITPKRILEIAPGHGLFGHEALIQFPQAELIGIDISDASVILSQTLAKMQSIRNAKYKIKDIFTVEKSNYGLFDTIICGELLEHIPEPIRLFKKIYELMQPNGFVYITAAINAAATDHIYIFRHQDEVKQLAVTAGFLLENSLCTDAPRIRSDSRVCSQTIAMILKRS
ncbi:MAG: hypothetical protein AUJ18_03870 [Candidatus Hydrogenedentes bacterium CG1_02_42_14]|nr:MAG: hypothetical protein AUJ18_03870 [Candidatus Hydrogenedentes bacterium CG1_02_42_14]